mmetsp:Transcript_147726/g.368129  ORF Transcript_147726/g.368129 Transcript_147726/m.368129 type:complete len:271 (-) Transcript_147726:41-853(-)
MHGGACGGSCEVLEFVQAGLPPRPRAPLPSKRTFARDCSPCLTVQRRPSRQAVHAREITKAACLHPIVTRSLMLVQRLSQIVATVEARHTRRLCLIMQRVQVSMACLWSHAPHARPRERLERRLHARSVFLAIQRRAWVRSCRGIAQFPPLRRSPMLRHRRGRVKMAGPCLRRAVPSWLLRRQSSRAPRTRGRYKFPGSPPRMGATRVTRTSSGASQGEGTPSHLRSGDPPWIGPRNRADGKQWARCFVLQAGGLAACEACIGARCQLRC